MLSPSTRESIMSHFRELVYRIKWILVWLIVGFGVAYFIRTEILDFLVAPLGPAMEGNPQLHFTSPVEPFFTYLKLSMKAGIFLAMPFILYHLWSFIAPGLYKKERRLVITVTFFGVLFFAGGVLFAYYLVFPYGFKFLIKFAQDSPGNVQLLPLVGDIFKEVFGSQTPLLDPGMAKVALTPTIMMGDYLKLIINLLLAFGIVFELPLLIYFLVTTGIVSPRGLLGFFRYFVVIAFTISAILTPPDVITQVMMALPLMAMYLISTLFAWAVVSRRQRSTKR
ncbi:twin-arginine translocase subunit TatC [Myxococcota bacterium]|nr:twin-arginine translocase subunit TatC [Myxococcota bacterium]MBU1535106.1 twin-arginine translocase subunit TatC [Myxococcota bacterium]